MGLGHCCRQSTDLQLLIEDGRNPENRVPAVCLTGIFRIKLYAVHLDPLIMGTAELDQRLYVFAGNYHFRAGNDHFAGTALRGKHGRHIGTVRQGARYGDIRLCA